MDAFGFEVAAGIIATVVGGWILHHILNRDSHNSDESINQLPSNRPSIPDAVPEQKAVYSNYPTRQRDPIDPKGYYVFFSSGKQGPQIRVAYKEYDPMTSRTFYFETKDSLEPAGYLDESGKLHVIKPFTSEEMAKIFEPFVKATKDRKPLEIPQIKDWKSPD